MRGFKGALTAVAALAAFAGVGATAAPAQAATYCTDNGGTYFCQYGITTTTLADGTKQEFVVGTDHAVWTNWRSTDGHWNGWQSLGGWVQSRVVIDDIQNDPSTFTMAAIGTDGNYWFRLHYPSGQWTAWQVSCAVSDTGPLCP
ncbi:hypothetical protein FSY75_28630 [Streptomyces sp. TR1341]|uniref:PLL-like beta propeller domain-containing protein n=1 Tax=Streptomyces murinus TaxID=33900 RepID=A0A7W3NNF1_STRMR|nr:MULTISPECIES: hypothetical protein [Streptomyces]MBA9053735.1 hypothetical protein [Streptomyces murinus]NDK28351.1 hypothetical protein [Streptomyces sp. TR1341]UWW94829.1 hypothetical protein GO605_31330 [Streptomyces murinus]WUD07308.1 hypothetical protein OG586_14190 [Streptomyces murinus]